MGAAPAVSFASNLKSFGSSFPAGAVTRSREARMDVDKTDVPVDVAALISQLADDREEVVSKAARSLAELCGRVRGGEMLLERDWPVTLTATSLLSSGAVGELVSAMRRHRNVAAVASSACDALLALSSCVDAAA